MMRSKTPFVSAEFLSSSIARVNISLSAQDAQAILDGHKNITGIMLNDIKKVLNFINENAKETQSSTSGHSESESAN